MSSLTKEQLRERARDKVKSLELAVTQTAFADSRAELEEELELARIALASLEAEPIYQLWDEGYYDTQKETYDTVLNAVDTGVRGRIVYTAPPALVSVPDESAIELLATDLMKRIDKITGERHSLATLSSLRVSIVEACRAAMLQGAENVESRCTIQTAPALVSLPKKCRARCGKSPVIPDGWVMVPVEPTEDMIVNGFESEPDESFSDEKEWEEYDAMSGCQQAAHRAKLCWAAMIAAAPKPEVK